MMNLLSIVHAFLAVAPWLLVIFWIWGRVDAWYLNKHGKLYKPVPKPEKPRYKTQDVSVLVCTIGPNYNFALCVRRWLANNPLELIFVTTNDRVDIISAILDKVKITLSPAQAAKIRLLSTPIVNKRVQMIEGVNAARGSILATVDDHILWTENMLEHMLPCFEDPQIGGVGPSTDVYIPADRQNQDCITVAETIATRMAWKRKGGGGMAFAATDWVWILAGTTTLFRTTILQDPKFQHAHQHDYWMGHKLAVGDDTFISRWLQRHGWMLAIQAMPETMIARTMHTTSAAYIKQNLRWERSTIQSHWRTLWEVRDIWNRPYALVKTIERCVRPALTVVHILAWMAAFVKAPRFTAIFFIYYIVRGAPSYCQFFAEYPYMLRYFWYVVLVDFSYIVFDLWAWATINDNHWGTRNIPHEEAQWKTEGDGQGEGAVETTTEDTDRTGP
ncbi:polysaccharide synthase [Xylariaceae sp. FL0016]|nr:polysaccharide synthase [Xylariaceae sp. FL0016]